jgi:hypothetical protein
MEYEGTDLRFLNLESEWSYVLNLKTQRFATKLRASFAIGQGAH